MRPQRNTSIFSTHSGSAWCGIRIFFEIAPTRFRSPSRLTETGRSMVRNSKKTKIRTRPPDRPAILIARTRPPDRLNFIDRTTHIFRRSTPGARPGSSHLFRKVGRSQPPGSSLHLSIDNRSCRLRPAAPLMLEKSFFRRRIQTVTGLPNMVYC